MYRNIFFILIILFLIILFLFFKIIKKDFFTNNNSINIFTIGDKIISRNELKKMFYNYKNIFSKIYNKYGSNEGGINLEHSFYLYCLIKKYNPQVIIESGSWNGIGTKFLREFSSNSLIICIDPMEPSIYKDKINSKYFVGKDFKDFNDINWNFLSKKQKKNTLIFFDDHQSAYKRIKQSYNLGFKHICFDDNYPFEVKNNKNIFYGDNYSFKKIINSNLFNRNSPILFTDTFGKIKRNITYHKAQDMKKEITNLVKKYYEFPPIINLRKNRFKINDNYDNIYQKSLFNKLHNDFKYKSGYTFFCYVNLN